MPAACALSTTWTSKSPPCRRRPPVRSGSATAPPKAAPQKRGRFMCLARRALLPAAAAAGLAARSATAAPKVAGPPGDAAINRYFDSLSEQILAASPETATSYGLDTGARAALKSRLSDASMAHVAHDRVWCRENLAKLAGFPDAGLSPAAKLNKDVVKYAFVLGREAAPFDYGENTLNSAMSEVATPYLVSQPGWA